MSIAEHQYHEGFIAGQEDLIGMWDQVLDETDGRTEAFEEFQRRIEELRREIESL